MDPATIAALGIQASNVASGIFGQKRNIRLQKEANMELANYQNQLNLDNWNRQNAYNTPAMQMERYKEAGLNPNLIYGSGQASAGNASSVSPAVGHTTDVRRYVPQFDPSQFVTMLSAYQDLRLKKAQADNVQAQTQHVIQQTATEPLRQLSLTLGNQRSEIDNRIARTLEQNNYDVARVNLQQLTKNLSKTDMDISEAHSRNLSRELERTLNSQRTSSQLRLNEEELFERAWYNQMRLSGVDPKQNPMFQLLGGLLRDMMTDKSNLDPVVSSIVGNGVAGKFFNFLSKPFAPTMYKIGDKLGKFFYGDPLKKFK